MAFDPDAYLAKSSPAPTPAFDPDAYLRATSGDIPGPRKGRSSVEQIPTEPGANLQPTVVPEQTFGQKVMGAIETPIAFAATAATGLPVYLAGAGGPEFQRRVAGQLQYRPRTQMAQEALEAFARNPVIEKLPPFMPAGGITPAIAPATRALGDVARAEVDLARGAVKAQMEPRRQMQQLQRIRESQLNAPRIDAAKDALDLGIALDPAASNPTAVNRLKSSAVGTTGLDANLSKINLPQITKVAKREMGLTDADNLDVAAFEKARSAPEISGAYEKIAKLSRIVADDEVFGNLDGLKLAPTLTDTGQAAKVNGFIDMVKSRLERGTDGATILKDIRQLRRDAQAIYNQQSAGINPPSPQALAQADASMGIANALETAIENSISNPRLLTEFRNARTALARTYDYERATNLATGVVDPQALAKLAAEGKPLSGDIAKLANIAANFPEVTQGGVFRQPSWREKLTRSSAFGTAGAIIGSPLGLPGSIIGGTVGAAGGNIGSALMARRMASPEFQRKNALPKDYRPAPTGLRPVEPQPSPNALVPYETEVLGPSEKGAAGRLKIVGYDENGRPVYAPTRPGAQPGFTMPPQPEFGNRPTTFVAQRGLPNEVPQQTARQIYDAQRRQDLAQGFREAAERKPTSGEIILDFDPVTGRFRTGSQGLPGATPETFSNFGAALETAASKVTAGQRFSLSAAEKVAWDRTRVDLADVAPGFKSLSDKAIAEKMLDRAWVEQTATKAREKAAAFEQMAARAKDERARQAAIANRERMMDLAEQMEETLRSPRPDVSGKQQGPKTRAARRNMLAGEFENQNALTR